MRGSMTPGFFFKLLVATCGSLAAWGCAEGSDDDNSGGSTSTGTPGPASTSSSFNVSSSSNAGGGPPVCTATSEQAERTTLDIIFVLDWSGSMQGESWQGSTQAFEDFVEDPDSEGINAGMVFFPTIKENFSDTCDPQLYAVLDVPIAELPGNSFALVNSMPFDAIGSPSPLYAGLRGAIQSAVAYQDLNPEHKVIVVLATDGWFNECGYGINSIAEWPQIARSYNGVETYVIGVQSSASVNFNNLNVIAAAGGTTVYDASNIDAFADKMAEIRDTALGCDFAIPPAPPNEMFVPDETNFTYTPGGNGTPITLPRADDLADCGDGPGWYFDNNMMPTKIIVCPASCDTIKNDLEAKVEVAFGCASVPN